jgi:hypothetical protein
MVYQASTGATYTCPEKKLLIYWRIPPSILACKAVLPPLEVVSTSALFFKRYKTVASCPS